MWLVSQTDLYRGFMTRMVYLCYIIMLEMHCSGREPSIWSSLHLFLLSEERIICNFVSCVCRLLVCPVISVCPVLKLPCTGM